jgi:hypothetical protein
VRSAEATHEVEYGYVASDGPSVCLSVLSKFVSGEGCAGQRRVVIVKGSFAGECKIAHCPNFVSADLRRLSEHREVGNDPPFRNHASPGARIIGVICRPDSGQTSDGVCKVKVWHRQATCSCLGNEAKVLHYRSCRFQ